jgi:DNA-binding MarR family transcriptional regulator
LATASPHLGRVIQRLMRHLHTGSSSNPVLKMLVESGMTTPQMAALTVMRQSQGSSISDLARALSLSLPATSQLVNRLVLRGWVERVEHGEDRRQKVLTVTPTALRVLAAVNEARGAQYAAVLQRLSNPLRAQLTAVVEQVVEELEGGANGAGDRKDLPGGHRAGVREPVDRQTGWRAHRQRGRRGAWRAPRRSV